MAPPARIDRAMTSSGVNLAWGPMVVVVGAQRRGDFVTVYGRPSCSVENGGEVCVWGGAVLS